MWKRALMASLSFFGWNIRTGVTLLGFWLLGAFIHYIRYGLDALLEEVATAISFSLIPIGAFLVGLYVFHLIRAPVYIRWEKEKEPAIAISPCEDRKQYNWERTEYLMWVGLKVTNKSPLQELKDVEVNIVTLLEVQESQSSPNDYVLFESSVWNPTAVYWSERNAFPQQMSLSIPRNATRIAPVAFWDNPNGGEFVFNSILREWKTGGVKIEVEVSSSNSASLKRAFYIECHPNYLGGDRAKFEFVEWEIWATNRNITLVDFGKRGSRT